MGALRRAIFGVLAVVALLFGLGSFTAAVACPASLQAVQHDDCCAKPSSADCAVLHCTKICQAMVPAFPQLADDSVAEPTVYWSMPRELDSDVHGPEPPPPRLARR